MSVETSAAQRQPGASEASLHFEHVGKSFARRGVTHEVLRDVHLSIGEGEFVAIIGRAGCGKSTLLNVAGGLTPASTGAVRLERGPLDALSSDRAVVTQKPVLLPWLTVYGNVRRAVDTLFASAMSKSDRHAWTMRTLALMGLAEAKDKRPLEISSGMKQAVGIAGALAMRPKILLLDEPFGGLDAEARAHLRTVLNEMHGELGLTILMATHAIDEALRLADRIAMLTSGPAARIGDVIAIAAARPRRLDPALLDARAALTAFLSRQQLFGEAA